MSDTRPELTSLKQIPALLRTVGRLLAKEHLDFGGGKFDLGSEFLLREHQVRVTVLDRYARPDEYGEFYGSPPAHWNTVTLANVLNVIETSEERVQALEEVRDLCKPGATVFTSVYHDRRKSPGLRGKPGRQTWQENRPLPTYLEEIQQVFPESFLCTLPYVTATGKTSRLAFITSRA